MDDQMMDKETPALANSEEDAQGTEQQAEEIVVQLECHHAPDGTRTYLVGRVPEGGGETMGEDEQAEAAGNSHLKPAASLDEALRTARVLLQGGDEAADAQAEKEFEQGFRGRQAAAY